MSAGRAGGSTSRTFWCALGLGVALLAVVVNWAIGASWGLPSERRNQLYFRSGLTAADMPQPTDRALWREYPNTTAGLERTGRYSRSAFNPLRSHHPDEYVVLKSLRDMYSLRTGFPGFFAWPPLYFYEVGAALGAAWAAGYVKLVPEAAFHYQHPEALARMYLVGRGATLLFGLIAVTAMWGLAGRLYGPVAAVVSAFFLAFCPGFSYHAGFMTTDIPLLACVLLTAYCAVRAMQEGAWRWYLLAGGCVGLAAATRYYGALAALAVIAAHALSEGDRRKPVLRRVFDRRLLCAGVIALAVFLVMDPYVLTRGSLVKDCAGLLGALFRGGSHTLTPGGFLAELSAEARGSQWLTVGRLDALGMFLRSGLGLPLTIMAVTGLCFMVIRNFFVARYREDHFVLISFLPAALVLLAGRPAMLRYLFPALPLMILAAGLVGTELVIAWPTRRNRFLLGLGIAAVALVAMLAWANSTSRALLRLRTDTRLEAGEWIAQNVPRGATVAMLEDPWQFQVPPLDMRFYNVVVTGQDAAKLKALAPEWFVCSDFQLPPLAQRGPLTAQEREFWRAFRPEGRYRLVREFHRWPRFLGLRFAADKEPHDMRYVNPRIYIYERLGSG